jgi:hypothetical protein
MNNCSNIPVELLIATTDPKLYDKNKWTWNGDLYWAIECLNSKQYTIAEEVIPNIQRDTWTVLKSNPMQWDFCKSKFCNIDSESILLVFTFKPDSSNPLDYLQYVIDLNCHVTDYPQNTITDNTGNVLYLDIVQVNKMINKSYLELWIAKSEHGLKQTETQLTLMPPSMTALHKYFLENVMSNNKSIIIILVALLVLIIVISIILIMYFKKSKTNLLIL